MLVSALLYVVAVFAGIVLHQHAPLPKLVGGRQLIDAAFNHVVELLPHRIQYVDRPMPVTIVEYVDRPIVVPLERSTREMSELVVKNVAGLLLSSIGSQFHHMGVTATIIIAVLTTIVLYLVIQLLRRGRPTNSETPWVLNVLNIFKSSRGVGKDNRPDQSLPQADHATTDATVRQIERLDKFKPGDDFDLWIYMFEEYVQQYATRLWNPLLMSSLSGECLAKAQLNIRDTYEQSKAKLTTTFSTPHAGILTERTLKAKNDNLGKFHERVQESNETAVDYLRALKRLCDSALPTLPEKDRDELVKAQFFEGLSTDQLRSDILRTTVQYQAMNPSAADFTLEQTIEFTRKFEEYMYNGSSSESSNSQSISTRATTIRSLRKKKREENTKAHSITNAGDMLAVQRYVDACPPIVSVTPTPPTAALLFPTNPSQPQQQIQPNNQQQNRQQQQQQRQGYHGNRNNNNHGPDNRHNNNNDNHQASQQYQQPRPSSPYPLQTQHPPPNQQQLINQQQPSATNIAIAQQNAAGTANVVYEPGQTQSSNLRGLCLIDGEPVEYEFDSGASITCINKAVYHDLAIRSPMKPCHKKFNGASGPMTIYGVVTVTLTIGKDTFQLDVLVAEIPQLQAILIGRDVYPHCQQFQRHIDALRQTISESTQAIKERLLTSNRATEAQSHTAREVRESVELHSALEDITTIDRPQSSPRGRERNSKGGGGTTSRDHKEQTRSST